MLIAKRTNEKQLNKNYLKLYREEQKAYKKFTGVMGGDQISQRTRDIEYANFLEAKTKRIQFRVKNKIVGRASVYKKTLALQ